ncbi:WD40 repeat-like protein [Basidiobolus meristosporus CBS 931.73]|uniref:WD40 repeat-like protein n=1 Tax=Basidiobolus meristosporus CBS 931.73 TaxID=1314790 RepID=A0A1Y1Y7E3_9FUNG|nr:WD40 repeat-like protein [Basidiobolus meristosporus CBS 931.73]|eukprot:ORX93815.1 WD40 repeat-like protein [Basidiobolus meristosporus CBS 931.73]
MSITSEEVNYLIYRYLKESGFEHSTFAFEHETHIHKSELRDLDVSPGTLINILQKGLQYMSIEVHLNEDGTERECSAPFSLLTPHKCEKPTKKHKREDSSSKRDDIQIKKERREERKLQKERERRAKKESIEAQESDRMETDTRKDTGLMEQSDSLPNGDESNKVIPSRDVSILNGHEAEVFVCSWNPTNSNLIASGAGDATARIWTIPSTKSKEPITPVILKHLPTMNSSKDVTTLDWNPSGTLLATGSYDGQARIWTQKGELRHLMSKHRGPIFSLKWNKRGNLLLSGSVDHTTILWDASNGEFKQQFSFHTAPTLDVDWLDDEIFATCSTDKTIQICQVGQNTPVKTFRGHQDEVNTVKWDPSGQFLASCSDDSTAKIWSLSRDTFVHDFREHGKEIYTIRWSPTGPNTDQPNAKRILATASFDSTVRLWDVENGSCLYKLAKHAEPVYSVSFSPDGQYIASGSFDQSINIWSVKDGALVKTYRGKGGIFEVSWNSTGDRLAACLSDNTVTIVDIRM